MAPLLFDALSSNGGEWAKLSDVGQVYSAVGAVVSSFALVGVAASLYLQSREARLSRELAHLSMQLEILRFGLEDPVLTTAMEPPHGSRAYSLDDYKRECYVHTVVRQKYLAFSIGVLDSRVVRTGMSLSFRGESFRRYWEDHGDHWMGGDAATDVTVRRFREIVESEYRRAVAEGPPIPPTDYFREGSS
ncbi:DUF6082 family protein [Streptomyces sp. NPDC029004]|uniref:DUF6082 family protein n=1 Tax=Streptomyces sp. NPDC029004 TaxID=3154490 RepID=UPI00340377C7